MIDRNRVMLVTTLIFLAIFFFLVLYKLHGPSLLDMESIFLGQVISR